MAATRAKHRAAPRRQWLRVTAAAVGLGAAISAGQAVASADTSDSSDPGPSASRADTSSRDRADATNSGARTTRGPKSTRVTSASSSASTSTSESASSKSAPSKSRATSAVSDRWSTDDTRRPARKSDARAAAAPLDTEVAGHTRRSTPRTAKPAVSVVNPDEAGPAEEAAHADVAPPSTGAVDLTDLRGRPDVDLTLNADGTVRVIGGVFADATVITAADAARQFNELASALGAPTGFAIADNITVRRVEPGDDNPGAVAEVFYRLTDSIDGIPVLGSEVILVTDADGRVTGLFNYHSRNVPSMDTTPDARIDDRVEAIAVASATYLSSTGRWTNPLGLLGFVTTSRFEPELVAYALDADAAPRLAWRVVVKPSDFPQLLGLAAPIPGVTYFIYANGSDAGTVLVQTANAQALSTVSTTSFAKDALGQRRQIDVRRLDLLIFSFYTMQDLSRNMTTYQTSYFLGLGPPQTPGFVAFRGLFGWGTSAVSAHANMATVYDYYADVLSLNSFDGNGARITVSVNYNPHKRLEDYVFGYMNAFWDPTAQQFGFGDSGKLEAALDVVGHEFTHAVVSHIVGNGGSVLDHGESGALNEAYADVLGSLIEGKSGPDRWLIGEDSRFTGGALRNLADPTSVNTVYGPYRDHYASRYTGSGDEEGEHINSTIFSHAAYLMMTDPATSDISDETWARMFYQSLYRLSPGATFTDGRAAILNTATTFGFAEAQQQAIEQAFDAVGIVQAETVNRAITPAAEIMV